MNGITWKPRPGNRDIIDGRPGGYELRVRRDLKSPTLGAFLYDVHWGETFIMRVIGPAQAKRRAERHYARLSK